MTEKPNPYRSPAATDRHETWWSKLRRWLRTAPRTGTPDFANGDAVICDGIAYFIIPDEPGVLYAASPSAKTDEKRVALVVAESARVLPMFLAEYPDLQAVVAGRRLFVRLICEYGDTQEKFLREVETDTVVDDAVLALASEGVPDGPV